MSYFAGIYLTQKCRTNVHVAWATVMCAFGLSFTFCRPINNCSGPAGEVTSSPTPQFPDHLPSSILSDLQTSRMSPLEPLWPCDLLMEPERDVYVWNSILQCIECILHTVCMLTYYICQNVTTEYQSPQQKTLEVISSVMTNQKHRLSLSLFFSQLVIWSKCQMWILR